MSSFKDKSVLITGGGSGIRLLMAKLVVKENASHIIIWDNNSSHLESAKAALGKEKASIIAQHVDIIINNAGMIAGKLFGVYHSMDTFTGRENK